jgi:putative nucleotidyltransferase with HDIG domain
MESIDHYINRVQNLPPAPTVAVQLLDLFSDPNRDIDRIVELVGLDPALTAETLKRCNSACLVGAEPAADMFEAVSRLGFYEIYCIVVALLGSQTMTLVRGRYGVDATRFWQHSVTTAVVATALARRVGADEATAFTAGLLHDIGKLILVSTNGIIYAGLLRDAGGCGAALVAAEESAMGFNHAALGARLLARWGLPENLCHAVNYHHQSPISAGNFQRLAATVNLANCLARQMIDGPMNTQAAADTSLEAMDLADLRA